MVAAGTAIVKPGDVVLVDRNCHKSHHYALMLAGARVAYLDSNPLNEFLLQVPDRTTTTSTAVSCTLRLDRASGAYKTRKSGS
ncbi:MAG: hypothetical protein NVS2B15_25990 [Pseudarthrobacter sp.]